MEFGAFNSRDTLLNRIKQHYLASGVSVLIDSGSNDRWLNLKCYHGGVYTNQLKLTEESRKRATGSRLLGCPFKIKAKQEDGV